MNKQRGHFFLTLFLTFIIVSGILVLTQSLLHQDSQIILYENLAPIKNTDPREVARPLWLLYGIWCGSR